jgi:hypothetical protein
MWSLVEFYRMPLPYWMILKLFLGFGLVVVQVAALFCLSLIGVLILLFAFKAFNTFLL